MLRRRVRLPLFCLDRYLTREILMTTSLGFLTYTFLLIMRAIIMLLEQVLVHGVSWKEAGEFLLVTLPSVAVLTIPMAFLFGVLIGLGRMNADNEIIAFQSAGVSLRRLLMPLVFLALVIAAGNAYLTLWVNPGATRRIKEVKRSLLASGKAQIIVEPRVFVENLPNILLYVNDIDDLTGYWRDVIIFDRTTPGEERLTLAHRGRLVSNVNEVKESVNGQSPTGSGSDSETAGTWLLLEDAVTHQFFPRKPGTYLVNANQSQLYRVASYDRVNSTIRYGVETLSTADLIKASNGEQTIEHFDPRESDQRRLAVLEMNKRFAIPSACIVFAMLALPLGIGSKSGGKGRGFVISIVVILGYYVLQNHGELLAREGEIPIWLGIWLPNIMLMALGLLLMTRMGNWLGERETREFFLVSWFRKLRGKQELAPARTTSGHIPLTGAITVGIKRHQYSNRFPALLDRYLFRRLLFPLALVVLSTTMLYLIIDLSDNIDEMARNATPVPTIVGYYWNLLPQIVIEVMPLAVLIAVLIVLTMLERNHELTAFKAGGLSLFRIMVPVLLLAGLCAGSLWVLEESVLPKCRRESNRLLDRIKGRETARSYSSDRFWLMSRDNSSLYNFLRYDSSKHSMLKFSMFRIDSSLNLRFHLVADEVQFIQGAWIARSGWYRQINRDGTDEFHQITKAMELGIPEAPDYFGQEYRRPAEMSFNELRRYIETLKDSGYRPVSLLVSLYQKLTYPLSAFVMVFLALPFTLNRSGKRMSTMQGIAAALALGIGYFVVVGVFGKLGEADILPPLLGAWMPALIAILFALNRLTTLRT